MPNWSADAWTWRCKDARFIVVDLSQVTFLDCHTLGVLIAAARRARDRGGVLSLAAASPAAHRVLGAFNLYSSLGGHRGVLEQQQHFQPLLSTPTPTRSGCP